MKRFHIGVALVLLALSVSLFLSGASLARHLSAKASLPGFTGPVQCVFVDPGNGWVYAGTEGGAGVYRSTDNGANWQEYGTGLGTKDVLTIVKRGTDILAGTWGDGVYATSVPGAANWSKMTGIPGDPEDPDSIRSMAVGSSYAYAAESRGRVWELASGSSTWQEIASLPLSSGQNNKFLFVDASDKLYAGVTSLGVYKYVGTWQAMGSLGSRDALAMDYGPDGNLWVGTSDGVYRWTGGQWSLVSGTSGWNITALKRSSQHTEDFFAGLATGAVYRYRQSTGGWEQVTDLDITTQPQIWSMRLGTGEPQRLFVAAQDGLYFRDSHHPNLTLENDPESQAALADSDVITYTAGFQNVGTSAIAGVVITSHIPAENVTYVDVSDPGTKVGQYVRWSVGSVGAGLTEEVTYTVRVELGDGSLGTLYSGGEELLGDGATANTIVEKPNAAPTLPPPTPTPLPPALIINEGAYATWQGGPEDGVTTAPVYNWIGSPHHIHLPLVMKNHGGS